MSERKEKKVLENGLLEHLLNKGQRLSDDQIADNIIGILFAAQDTTASALTWIIKYLHDHPKLLQAVKVIHLLQKYIYSSMFLHIYFSTNILVSFHMNHYRLNTGPSTCQMKRVTTP